jgi:hypothetical protein
MTEQDQQTTSTEWCVMVFDGIDTNGDIWNRCIVHNRLVYEDAYVCEGYQAAPYVDPVRPGDLS